MDTAFRVVKIRLMRLPPIVLQLTAEKEAQPRTWQMPGYVGQIGSDKMTGFAEPVLSVISHEVLKPILTLLPSLGWKADSEFSGL
jgi:hypothetical protein